MIQAVSGWLHNRNKLRRACVFMDRIYTPSCFVLPPFPFLPRVRFPILDRRELELEQELIVRRRGEQLPLIGREEHLGDLRQSIFSPSREKSF